MLKDEPETWVASALEVIKTNDILLIAPLDANTLAKVAVGIADNLLVIESLNSLDVSLQRLEF